MIQEETRRRRPPTSTGYEHGDIAARVNVEPIDISSATLIPEITSPKLTGLTDLTTPPKLIESFTLTTPPKLIESFMLATFATYPILKESITLPIPELIEHPAVTIPGLKSLTTPGLNSVKLTTPELKSSPAPKDSLEYDVAKSGVTGILSLAFAQVLFEINNQTNFLIHHSS